MYMGQIVEIGPRRAVFENPQHPYTRKLMSAVPIPDPKVRRDHFATISGEIPSPVHDLSYQPVYADLQPVGPGHFVARSASQDAA
jgi:ABC-type oligopeptide transport system ATPase subunit